MGTPVVMTFEVTNPGNIPVLDVEVTDDRGLAVTFTGGDANGDNELDPDETWTYEADVGPAIPGRFDNIGTVTGLDVLENPLTDDDPAFIFAQPAPTTTTTTTPPRPRPLRQHPPRPRRPCRPLDPPARCQPQGIVRSAPPSPSR